MRCLTILLSLIISLALCVSDIWAVEGGVSMPPGSRVPERVTGLSGLKNVGVIEEGLYRGAQPEVPDGYETLKRMGIKTVLNLRARHSEREEVEAHGMTSLEIPMSMLDTPEAVEVERAVLAMADLELRPLYVHCALGEDRTGVVVAIYRIKEHGWSLKEAEAEMQAFGFNDIWVYLKRFLRSYAEEIAD